MSLWPGLGQLTLALAHHTSTNMNSLLRGDLEPLANQHETESQTFPKSLVMRQVYGNVARLVGERARGALLTKRPFNITLGCVSE